MRAGARKIRVLYRRHAKPDGRTTTHFSHCQHGLAKSMLLIAPYRQRVLVICTDIQLVVLWPISTFHGITGILGKRFVKTRSYRFSPFFRLISNVLSFPLFISDSQWLWIFERVWQFLRVCQSRTIPPKGKRLSTRRTSLMEAPETLATIQQQPSIIFVARSLSNPDGFFGYIRFQCTRALCELLEKAAALF